jgi:hypothetical protein
MLPAVLAFNSAVNGDRQAEISAALGASDQPAAEVLDSFITGLGLPQRLRDVGVKRDDLQRIARTACSTTGPFSTRPIHGAQESYLSSNPCTEVKLSHLPRYRGQCVSKSGQPTLSLPALRERALRALLRVVFYRNGTR